MEPIKAITVGGKQYDVVFRQRDDMWVAYAIEIIIPAHGLGWGKDTNTWASGATVEKALENLVARLSESGA